MAALPSVARTSMELSREVRTSIKADREHRPALVAGFRALERSFFLHRPASFLGITVLLVGLPIFFDLIPTTSDWIGTFTTKHEVAVSLLEHLFVAFLVGAFAYYKVLGLKRQRALKGYRETILEDPRALVDWYPGEWPDLRDRASRQLGDEIIRSREPAVAVVKGRAGTGRTSFIVELAHYLAQRGLIPIPVRAPRDGSFDLEALAKKTFKQNIDFVTSSYEQADAIWRFACHTRAIVVLVDGLDKEVLERLKPIGGRGATEIRNLRKEKISVVLATTLDLESEFDVDKELGLGRAGAVLREDLDRFTHAEAEEYLQRAFKQTAAGEDHVRAASGDAAADPVAAGAERLRIRGARAALDQLHDRADDSLVDPFYLDLIVRLQKNDISLENLPAQTDHWRAAILTRYLEAIEDGAVAPENGWKNPDRVERPRGPDAKRAAERVAEKLELETDLTVERHELDEECGRALSDAADLNLLRDGDEYVSFTSDDLGAYLVAASMNDPTRLVDDARQAAEGNHHGLRHERFALTALTFWHLGHHGPERHDAFESFVEILEDLDCAPPRLAAGAIRIVSACEDLAYATDRVGAIARRSVDMLCSRDERSSQSFDVTGPVRLVRALARWRAPEAHRLLWRLATSRNLDVEWPAVKALATCKGDPGQTLQREIAGVLDAAEASGPRELSVEGSALGNELASLAWMLPSLRRSPGDSSDWLEVQWSRATRLCLAEDMSPLRGEMAVAQGLKLAIVSRRFQNIGDVNRLLDRPLRFWHARLVLVHALLAYACQQPIELGAFCERFKTLRARESHPLVKRGMELAMQGLVELGQLPDGDDPAARMYDYMWRHEHDAVTWVEQSKWKVSRLAADVVLLSNMTYRLWRHEGVPEERIAAQMRLPSCIRDTSHRDSIIKSNGGGCDCEFGLCARDEPPAVSGTWARFTPGFCHEQARLAALHGPPLWAKGRIVRKPHGSNRLEEYWQKQAKNIVQRRSEEISGAQDTAEAVPPVVV